MSIKVFNTMKLFLFRGGWQGNVRHGHGMMTYPDGRIYEGQWVEDSREGFGTLTYPGVSRQYAGDWEADRRDGYGVMLYGQDSSYEVVFHFRHRAETVLAPLSSIHSIQRNTSCN